MTTSLPDLLFKFYPVNQSGQVASFRRFEGKADMQTLTLDNTPIPFVDVYSVHSFQKRIVLQYNPAILFEGKLSKHVRPGGYLVMDMPSAVAAKRLKERADQLSTLEAAKKRKKQLDAEGKGDTFKIVQCSHCKSTIDISGLSVTPLVYCSCCNSLQNQEGQVVTNGDEYGICPESGLFDRLQVYTAFYFYFLLFVYGWSSQKKQMGDFWAGSRLFPKMLAVNFLFILGIVPAIMVKIKSSKDRDPRLKNLAMANKLAHQGKVRELNEIVDQFTHYYPNHPGILLNVAKAAQKANNDQLMNDAIKKALDTCANYYPAVQLLIKK